MTNDRIALVTVFGGATLDRVARTDAPPVMGASNPGSVTRAPGGVGFNVATILGRLGMPVRLVSRIGRDADGNAVTEAVRSAGVDTGLIAVSDARPTGGYHASIDEAGHLIIGIADMKVCEEMTPATLTAAVAPTRAPELWVIDANLPAETIEFLAEEARASGRPIAALSVSPAKARRLVPVLDRLTYVFTNRREAPVLAGIAPDTDAPAAELAAAIASTRAASVIVTDGAEPLALAEGTHLRSFVPLRAAVKGVNGAGDSFAAGTIAGLAEGLPMADAMRRGLAAAVLTLEAGSVAAAPFAPGALATPTGKPSP